MCPYLLQHFVHQYHDHQLLIPPAPRPLLPLFLYADLPAKSGCVQVVLTTNDQVLNIDAIHSPRQKQLQMLRYTMREALKAHNLHDAFLVFCIRRVPDILEVQLQVVET